MRYAESDFLAWTAMVEKATEWRRIEQENLAILITNKLIQARAGG